MPGELLPLFPLSVVLFPRLVLPLHIFEERYKEMIGAVLRDQSEFGVVLAANEGIAAVGCTATVDEVVRKYEDGRMDIVTQGRRRFQLLELNNERSYLRGKVEYFEDSEDVAPFDLREQAVRSCVKLAGGGEQPPWDTEDPQLSFQLAQRVEDLRFRQELLASRSETERLRRIVDYLPEYAERIKDTERMRELAPKNGHGRVHIGGKDAD